MILKEFLEPYPSAYYTLNNSNIIRLCVSIGQKCFKKRMRYENSKYLSKGKNKLMRICLDAGFMDNMFIDLEEEITNDDYTHYTIKRIEFNHVEKIGTKHTYMANLKRYFGNVVDNYDVETDETEPEVDGIHMLKDTITLRNNKEGIGEYYDNIAY